MVPKIPVQQCEGARKSRLLVQVTIVPLSQEVFRSSCCASLSTVLHQTVWLHSAVGYKLAEQAKDPRLNPGRRRKLWDRIRCKNKKGAAESSFSTKTTHL